MPTGFNNLSEGLETPAIYRYYVSSFEYIGPIIRAITHEKEVASILGIRRLLKAYTNERAKEQLANRKTCLAVKSPSAPVDCRVGRGF